MDKSFFQSWVLLFLRDVSVWCVSPIRHSVKKFGERNLYGTRKFVDADKKNRGPYVWENYKTIGGYVDQIAKGRLSIMPTFFMTFGARSSVWVGGRLHSGNKTVAYLQVCGISCRNS